MRVETSCPSRSASTSSEGPSTAVACERRSAMSRASAASRLSRAERCCARACQESSSAAAMIDTAAATTDPTKTLVRKLVRIDGQIVCLAPLALTQESGSDLIIHKLVTKLFHGDQRIDKDGQFFAQTTDVDVHRARASRIAVTPDVAEQQIAGQHASAMLQQVLQQHELLRRELHFASIVEDRVAAEVHHERTKRQP